MNWTGGTLQRTKHANKGVKQKQRAYFARARTKLQQSPNTPAPPFRPDFIRESDDREYSCRISPFASSSVRHAGHSASKGLEKEERHISPTAQRQRRVDDRGRPQETKSHSEQEKSRDAIGREESRETRRKQSATDIETQLLEANKRRLLKQQDWVGTASSKPVDLQYSSTKEKTQVGKRKKLVGKSRAATCRRSPVTFLHRPGQVELGDRDNTFMSGALPALAAADSIRVRIGSDALTTAASTQPIRNAPSQANSDSMLFDEEVDGAVRRKESETPQGVPSYGHRLAINPRMFIDQPAKINKSHSPKHGLLTHHILARRSDIHADESIRHTSADSDTLDQFIQPSEAPEPCYRLTHRVGSIERPLKLTFSGRRTARIDHTVLPTDKPGETQLVRANHAEELEAGHASRNVSEAHQIFARRHPNPPPIDDDEPWRPYLDPGTSSSGRVDMDDWTGMSVPQPHVPARNPRAERVNQPQHSVQGNLTRTNLLTFSASLPTPNRRSARLLDARPLPRADTVKGFGIDEAFWQSYALGSDPQSAIETIHTHSETSEDSTSRATKGYASTRLPLSTAVTSVSSAPFPSTPFRSLSGQASRISDDVQYAPRSGSRSITAAPPYAVWGGVESPHGEDVPSVERGDKTTAGSHFAEQSTHASLQNHASHVNEMFSDTRSSRSDLDRHSRARDDVSRLAQASESSVWQRDRDSSIWDIADSDGAGIDLVDVDRLT